MDSHRSLEIGQLLRDKYGGDPKADLTQDIARLDAGEPLAYVIGWIPFLGLTIRLDSHPLIPRPETEWWTEELIAHLKDLFGDTPFRLLDMCAGSGAIGFKCFKAPTSLACFLRRTCSRACSTYWSEPKRESYWSCTR